MSWLDRIVEWPIRKVVWALDLEDGGPKRDPSLTKGLALMFGVLVVVAVLLEKTVTGMHVLLATAAISAAFGRSMWKNHLAKGQWALQGSQSNTSTTTKTHTITEQIARQIIERRDAELGVDPTND